MRILITGVNGFVGQALLKQLSQSYDAYGLYRSGQALSENCYKIDLTDHTSVLTLFKEKFNGKIDTIIHIAARMASSTNLDDISVIADNANMAKNIAVAARENGIKHIINFSSSSVYPNIDGLYDETSEINPSVNSDCIYGLSKYNSEVVLNYMLRGSEIILTHLRIGVIYGAGMNSTRLIPMLEKELADTKKMTLYGNGERLQSIISVNKLAEYVKMFAQYPVNDIINVAEETITVHDLAKRITAKSGTPNSKIELIEKGNKSKFALDISKLKLIIEKNKLSSQ